MTGHLAEDVIGDVAVLTVTGELDLYTAPLLRESLQRMGEQGYSVILLDLTGCGFLDPIGLSVIVGGLKRARAKGGDLAVCGAPELVLKVLRITGLINVVKNYESRDKAVAEMGGDVS
jgi:anti-sigma B factor antagonist